MTCSVPSTSCSTERLCIGHARNHPPRTAEKGAAQNMRVAVIGAGVAGPALAMLLKQNLGWTPVVFDAAHAIREVGAGISLAPNGLRVLGGDSLRTSPSLAHRLCHEVGEPMPITHVMRPDGSTITQFDSKGEQRYGFPMLGIRRFRLLNTMLEAMQQLDIPLQLGKKLTAIEGLPATQGSSGKPSSRGSNPSGPVTLQFQDGSSFEADLVVGCDGLRSRTRAILQGGTEAPPRYTGNEVIFAVTCDRNADLVPHNHVQMVYGPPSTSNTGGQHYGAYGLGPDASWFVSLGRATAAESGSSSGSSSGSQRDSWGPVTDAAVMEAIKDELRDRFKGWSPVQRMLDRDVAALIRVGIFDREPTKSWVRGPVTLAGDAAAPIPPNLGQGGNKALENAGVLAQCLARHKGDIPLALAQYERLSSKRAAELLDYSRQASAMANLTSPVGIAARNSMLRSVVWLNGGMPTDWLWKYDCQAVVEADGG